MDELVWGRTRGNTLEDAYNALIKKIKGIQ